MISSDTKRQTQQLKPPVTEKVAKGLSMPAVPVLQQKESVSQAEAETTTKKSLAQFASADSIPSKLFQLKPNNTGMPDNLKSGIENLSGISMDHVKVHYNSSQPAQLNAHAYAQGSDIHIAPGQEKHLPHEAWHVVQQAQGRVQATKQLKTDILLNDDAGLEHEADVMGEKALSTSFSSTNFLQKKSSYSINNAIFKRTTQRVEKENETSDARHTFLPEASKVGFLAQLKEAVYEMANAALAEINQTANDCPYISKWFSYYKEKDSAHVSEAILRFAPEAASVSEPEQLIAAIVARVETSLKKHIETGSTDDVPAEIMEEKHLPQDFKHIVEKENPTVQLSCLWKTESGHTRLPQEDVEAQVIPTRHQGKSHYISEGLTAVAQTGDKVMNLGTTSCGLVLAFGSDAVGCFHWPFMTNSRGHFSTFTDIQRTIGTLNSIVIITNDFPPSGGQSLVDGYLETARAIRDNYGVTTTYYVVNGQIKGDPYVTLQDGGRVDSLSGGLRQVPL